MDHGDAQDRVGGLHRTSTSPQAVAAISADAPTSCDILTSSHLVLPFGTGPGHPPFDFFIQAIWAKVIKNPKSSIKHLNSVIQGDTFGVTKGR